MPKTDKSGHAIEDEIPSTLERSEQKAQDTFAQTYDSAFEQYQDESRAARTAWAAVKHSFEKVGDHWEAKEEKGPSDPAGEQGGRAPRAPRYGGVDANAPKAHLLELARRLDVRGRSTMTKAQLVEALQSANDKATREARGE